MTDKERFEAFLQARIARIEEDLARTIEALERELADDEQTNDNK